MAKQRILLHDRFIGANSTELTSHTPIKQYIASEAWATVGTDTIPQIQSNYSSATADATNNTAVFDIGRINCKITADIVAGTTSGNTNYFYFYFRYLNANNNWAVQVGETAAASFNLKIIETVGGVAATKASRTCTFADATAYTLVINNTGDLVYVEYSDGAGDLWFRRTDHFAPGTLVGFMQYIAATSTTYPLIDEYLVLG